MDSAVIIALIVSIPPTITALGAWMQARRNSHLTKEATAKVQATAAKVEEIHTDTNGLKKELVEATRIMAYAAGLKEGLARGRAETADTPEPRK